MPVDPQPHTDPPVAVDAWPLVVYPIEALMCPDTFRRAMDIVIEGRLPKLMDYVKSWCKSVSVPESSNPPVIIKENLMVRSSTCRGEARGANLEGTLDGGDDVFDQSASQFVNLLRPKQGGQFENDDSSFFITMAKWTPVPLAELNSCTTVLVGADTADGVYGYVPGDLVRALMDWPGREKLHQALREKPEGTEWKPPELSTPRDELTGEENVGWRNCIVRSAPEYLDIGEGGSQPFVILTPCWDGSPLHGPQEGDTHFVVHASRILRTTVVLTSNFHELSLMEVSIVHSFDEFQRDP